MNKRQINILVGAANALHYIDKHTEVEGDKPELEDEIAYHLHLLGQECLEFNRSKYEDGKYDSQLFDTRKHFANDKVELTTTAATKLVNKVLGDLFTHNQVAARDIYHLFNYSK